MPYFETRLEIGHPVDRVFAWHDRPGSLLRLFPPWWSVRVVSGPARLSAGDRVVLRVGRGPVRVTSEFERSEMDPAGLIVDRQVRGPLERWCHTHRLEPIAGGGTALVDAVEWRGPAGPLGALFGTAHIRRELTRIFEFRARRIDRDLSLMQRYGADDRPRIAVTGSTGLIGMALSSQLEVAGYRVVRISRSHPPPDRTADWIRWDPASGHLPAGALEGVRGVVHLAGETIAGLRWTPAKKRRIVESRQKGTELLSRTLAALGHPPRVLLVASAVGFYGNRGEEWLTEESGPGTGFLAEVCRKWETAADPARRAGIRTVHMRTGLVLSPAGGALGQLLLPFRMGFGGRIGTGRQYVSWIDLDDHTGLALHAMSETGLRGALNAVSPAPLTNAAFTDVLGRVLRRPTLLPVPGAVLRGAAGEMGVELLLSGQRATPAKALRTGYEFRFSDLELSLRHQLGIPEASP